MQRELLPELQKRGFVIEMSEPCAPVFFPRSLAKEHPEWFALNHGSRKLGPPPYSGQMCYSNKDDVPKGATNPAVAVRIGRLKTYVEYSRLHGEAMASGKPADLERLGTYSEDHSDESMVLMYPAYIKWRNSD